MKILRAFPAPTAPSLRVLIAFLVVGVLALELGVSASTRVGLQVAPAVWIGVIALTLALFGLGWARVAAIDRFTAPAEPKPSGTDPIDTAFQSWKASAEVLDARITFPEFLYPARKARMAIFPSGTTFLAARFATRDAALSAARGYRDFFGMAEIPPTADSAWAGPRNETRDFASIRCQGDLLLVWSSRDASSLEPRPATWLAPDPADAARF